MQCHSTAGVQIGSTTPLRVGVIGVKRRKGAGHCGKGKLLNHGLDSTFERDLSVEGLKKSTQPGTGVIEAARVADDPPTVKIVAAIHAQLKTEARLLRTCQMSIHPRTKRSPSWLQIAASSKACHCWFSGLRVARRTRSALKN